MLPQFFKYLLLYPWQKRTCLCDSQCSKPVVVDCHDTIHRCAVEAKKKRRVRTGTARPVSVMFSLLHLLSQQCAPASESKLCIPHHAVSINIHMADSDIPSLHRHGNGFNNLSKGANVFVTSQFSCPQLPLNKIVWSSYSVLVLKRLKEF